MDWENIQVALISPPQTHLSDPTRAEPLGLMYLEGILQSAGINADVFDMSFESEIPKADIYAFSASTVNFLKVVKYANSVKPAYTIVGGPHVSALPGEATKWFDAVVIGPGEFAILNAIEDFGKGLKGYIYRKSIEQIDRIPIPPRHIWKKIRYVLLMLFGEGVYNIGLWKMC